MGTKATVWMELAWFITRVLIIPIVGIALNLWLVCLDQGWALSWGQIIYLAAVLRLAIYTAVRTAKLDWRD